MLDSDGQRAVRTLQLYLRPGEATELKNALEALLRAPEATEHAHVLDQEGTWNLSVSLVTDAKLRSTSGYTESERRLFQER
jgi:hypothetical protein